MPGHKDLRVIAVRWLFQCLQLCCVGIIGFSRRRIPIGGEVIATVGVIPPHYLDLMV